MCDCGRWPTVRLDAASNRTLPARGDGRHSNWLARSGIWLRAATPHQPGALADFDAALVADPAHALARYNRGTLRDSLILCGRAVFDAALRNPDSLADLETGDLASTLSHEGYAYVAPRVHEEMTGAELPAYRTEYPAEPAGEPWNEDSADDLKRICPRLVAKFGP